MEESKPVDVLCVYRLKKGKEEQFLSLLEKHWPTLDRVGLVSKEPARVWRGTDNQNRSYFVETFQWRSGEAAGVAHQMPEVMAVWEPMGALAEDMQFLNVEPVEMRFE